MSLCTLQECLDFLDVDSKGSFEIASVNDVLKLTSDEGGPQSIDTADGTYEGDGLATALQTAMNADDTLTGTGTITFAVTYNATTKKFTLDATAGHTVAYTHSGSDAGLTFGFTADQSAAQTNVSDTAVPGDPSDIIQTLLDGLDKWVKNRCGVDFESTAYAELYDGTGQQNLFLDQFPIISLTRVSPVDSAIKIKNTASDADNAYYSVSSTGITLTVQGGASESESTLTFASYATMSALVTQINAEGNGWSAEIYNTSYNSYRSSILIERENEFCGAWTGTAAWHYMDFAEEPYDDIIVYGDEGRLYRAAGFPFGHENLYISYTAGYSSVPNDIKMGFLMSMETLYRKRNQQGFGLASFSIGALNVRYADILPGEALAIFDSYEQIMVV